MAKACSQTHQMLVCFSPTPNQFTFKTLVYHQAAKWAGLFCPPFPFSSQATHEGNENA